MASVAEKSSALHSFLHCYRLTILVYVQVTPCLRVLELE